MVHLTQAYRHFALAFLLAGCASGGSVVEIGDNAWRLAAIDYTEGDATRLATDQVKEFCAKRGQVPYVVMTRTVNDMPARYNSTIEFVCTAGGTSAAAQAEWIQRGYQRDCAIAGFPLGTPPNMKCAMEISAKVKSKPSTAP